MNKKFKILGMVVSIALVIFGIVVMCGTFAEYSYPRTATTGYDSGYAIFGADFYNYVCNNSAEAASATRTVAYNTIDLIKLVSGGFGAVIMAMGLLGFCFFGMVPGGVIKVENIACAAPSPVAVPAPVAVPVETPAVESKAVAEDSEEPLAVEIQEPEAEVQVPDVE